MSLIVFGPQLKKLCNHPALVYERARNGDKGFEGLYDLFPEDFTPKRFQPDFSGQYLSSYCMLKPLRQNAGVGHNAGNAQDHHRRQGGSCLQLHTGSSPMQTRLTCLFRLWIYSKSCVVHGGMAMCVWMAP